MRLSWRHRRRCSTVAPKWARWRHSTCRSKGLTCPLAPVVDGEVMAETVLQAASSPANKDVTLMVGTTAHEFKMAMRDQDWITRDVLRDALLRSGARPDLADEYLALHSKDNPAETAGQVKTDRGFRVLAHRLLEAWDEAAGTGFGYEFRWAPSDGDMAGVSVHAVDLPFAFDLLGVEGMEEVAGANPPQEVADAMHGSFVSFVKDMSPGWPEYHAGERATMVFDVPPHVEYDPAALELELWGQAQEDLLRLPIKSPSLGQAGPCVPGQGIFNSSSSPAGSSVLQAGRSKTLRGFAPTSTTTSTFTHGGTTR